MNTKNDTYRKIEAKIDMGGPYCRTVEYGDISPDLKHACNNGTCRAYTIDRYFYVHNFDGREGHYISGNHKMSKQNFQFLVHRNDLEDYLKSILENFKTFNRTFGLKYNNKFEIVEGSNGKKAILVTPTKFWKHTPAGLSLLTLLLRKDNFRGYDLEDYDLAVKHKDAFREHNCKENNHLWDDEYIKTSGYSTKNHGKGIREFLKSKNLI